MHACSSGSKPRGQAQHRVSLQRNHNVPQTFAVAAKPIGDHRTATEKLTPLSATLHLFVVTDFIAIHWYGSWNDVAGFKNYVSSISKKFNLPIWVTEYGVTSSSGGSQQQVKQFHMDATTWLNSQSYVERSSNFGSFAYSSPPDAYGSKLNALFNGDGSLRDLAYWYMWSSAPQRRSVRVNSTAEADYEQTKKEIPIQEKPASFSP